MEEATAGAAAGVVGTLLGYPLDTIKVRYRALLAGAHAGRVLNRLSAPL